MKLTLLLLTILLSTHAISQETAKTEITSFKRIGQRYEVTVTSNKKFYVGGNVHVLNIGTQKIKYSKIDPSNGKSITFLLTEADYTALENGNDIWMTYGEKTKEKVLAETDIKKMCEASPNTCWYLGKFDSSTVK